MEQCEAIYEAFGTEENGREKGRQLSEEIQSFHGAVLDTMDYVKQCMEHLECNIRSFHGAIDVAFTE